MKHIKGVIFDLDSTLVTCKLCFKTMRKEIGCPLEQDILQFVDALDEPKQSIANHTIKRLELDDAHSATWIEGAEHFVQYLINKNYPTAIITRNSVEASSIKIANNQIPIETVITREDAPAKPDPTALLMLAEKWNIAPANLLYIGDFLHDINIAKNAGVESALFCEFETPDYAHQADYVFESYAELLQRFD
ncbi:HAD family hydrolase [Pseudoalteromonas spongiae]|uniref:HAD family hydrolase n=1 Tax=Pseudoalteromonas spongiae TaxID=298657 RepID=UPI00110BA0CF|nr:HAD-IA family hydrolase [Pseudoalteromonas spongiae]TMO83019.1 phosphatase [Pseudoalteromonas spongiae]